MSTTTDSNKPIRTEPFPAMPPRFDGKERAYLDEALKRNTLFYNQPDGLTARLLERIKQEIGGKYVTTNSSGTAAIHAAVAAVGVKPGDEVITSPITDAGTYVGIVYQNAIPVFADLDPRTYHLTAETIEAKITDRTRAVILVHLTGAPCDMDPILALCKKRNIAVIEDAAQSYGCWYDGKHVGTMGDVGCFSLNDFKHLSAGDGGFCVTDSEDLYYKCHNYADKFYDRHKRGVRLSMIAPNYRITELQSAVALAQFDQFKHITETRRKLGDAFNAAISDIPGILPQIITPKGKSSYWFIMFRMDPKVLGMDRPTFVERLNQHGIPAGGGYTAHCCYKDVMFQEKSFFPGGVWPAELVAGKTYDYTKVSCPNAELILDTAVRLPVHHGMTLSDMQDMARAIQCVAQGN